MGHRWRLAPFSIFPVIFSLLISFNRSQVNAYNLVHEYAGLSFFDGWDFYGSWDNLTLGLWHFSFYLNQLILNPFR